MIKKIMTLLIITCLASCASVFAIEKEMPPAKGATPDEDLTLINHKFNPEESGRKNELSWYDLRIPESQYTAKMQDERNQKLVMHKHMGTVTLGLVAASVLTAVLAKKNLDDDRAARGGRMDKSDADNFNLHILTAGVTLASYLTTAYFSISAPKADVMLDSNKVKWHKRLASVHMPAMILGPIFGMKAISDYKKGKNPSGIGKLHRPLMLAGAAALLGAAITIEF